MAIIGDVAALASVKELLLKLAFSNLLLAAGGGGFACATLILCDLDITPIAVALPIMVVYVVYTLDKTLGFDPDADTQNDPQRCAFLARWRWPMLGAAIAALIGGLVLAALRSWHVALLFSIPLVVGVVYGVKLLPAGFRYRRLKDITGVKSGVVATTWTVGTVLMPAVYAGGAQGRGFWVLLAWVGLRFFVNTVYFDLGDLAGDLREGTRTLPVALGHRATLMLLALINLATAGLLFAVILVGWLPPTGHLVNLIALYGVYFLAAARSPDRDLGFLCDVMVDGEGVVVGLLAAVGLVATV